MAAIDGLIAGIILLADRIRPQAAEAVEELSRLGVESVMLTGDRRETAESVAKEVGVKRLVCGMRPEDKRREVERARLEGHRVAFVGDGINDAPALAAADVGMTFASATDVAVEAADITIVHDDFTRLALVVRLARRSVRIIKQNLFWAFFYNLAALPLAATGRITPGVAAAAMMFSSISVVLNSLRLGRWPNLPSG